MLSSPFHTVQRLGRLVWGEKCSVCSYYSADVLIGVNERLGWLTTTKHNGSIGHRTTCSVMRLLQLGWLVLALQEDVVPFFCTENYWSHAYLFLTPHISHIVQGKYCLGEEMARSMWTWLSNHDWLLHVTYSSLRYWVGKKMWTIQREVDWGDFTTWRLWWLQWAKEGS